ncbi:hypothetical protein [Pseudomonas aeruginosa]|jgi:hypothetical protein|uniref:Uncharacterized protein n=1 Tax=Myoviridae sp. ctu2j3 TaxID=2825197 RepID=A0A8S5UI82_9CAUD|nr:hypothetical protein [Pseudomonas aeruginosa]MDW8832705.1 hypothetical protein [Pseudomonas aeruginosa]DAF94202.1 MAG TPA: hypothetical protein [Myoviridae sp. ctu2j3]DAF94209.1 MAG TPA: hypothetical protein [Myoviridae sp. ctu2j3]
MSMLISAEPTKIDEIIEMFTRLGNRCERRGPDAVEVWAGTEEYRA